MPERAQFSIEHERDDDEEEIEFQLKWSLEPEAAAESEDDSPGGLVSNTDEVAERGHRHLDGTGRPDTLSRGLAELTTWLTGKDSCTL